MEIVGSHAKEKVESARLVELMDIVVNEDRQIVHPISLTLLTTDIIRVLLVEIEVSLS